MNNSVVCVRAGYTRLLSGDVNARNRPRLAEDQQQSLFPETAVDRLWATADHVKRYYLSFPFYPFRTLCPRDMQRTLRTQQELDPTSPLFPAHTQMSIVFRRRKDRNFLSSLLPYQLDSSLGSSSNTLTQDQRNAATTFRLSTAANPPVVTNYTITRVNIAIRDMYLQVCTNLTQYICFI